jgi:hypothetical protein
VRAELAGVNAQLAALTALMQARQSERMDAAPD